MNMEALHRQHYRAHVFKWSERRRQYECISSSCLGRIGGCDAKLTQQEIEDRFLAPSVHPAQLMGMDPETWAVAMGDEPSDEWKKNWGVK